MARQGYANAQFEVDGEEGLEIVEEFYSDENQDAKTEQVQVEITTIAQAKAKPKSNSSEGFMQDIRQGLKRFVQA